MNSARRKRPWPKSIIAIVSALFAAPILVGTLMCAYRTHNQIAIRRDTRISQPTGIESLEEVTLGGVDQWILIRSEDQSKPVLLWLHGGPGSPTMPLASQHDKELVKHFVVVHWDQRGAGKSYSTDIPERSMVVDQFVSDTHELTEELAERFGAPKIYLIGHSWGSQVGMRTIAQYPDSYYAFVSLGQYVNSVEAEDVGYRFALAQAVRRGNRKALRELEGIGPPPWKKSGQRTTCTKWINRFGGTGRQFTTLDYLHEMIKSPEYTLRDLFGYVRGMWFSGNIMHINGELERIDLFQHVPKVDVPVHFFQGRYDYSTPGEVVERYFEMLSAPQKTLVWFEESAHFPQWEEPQRFTDELLKIVSQRH
jgi:pimeloyl-ACP methyl ester carboxylesterase